MVRHGARVDPEVVAILHVDDADRASAWWLRLGFERTWTHRFSDNAPAFVEVRSGSTRVFLSEHEGDARPDTLLQLWVDDLDGIAREFDVTPEPAEWNENVRELGLSDPDGNRLRVTQR